MTARDHALFACQLLSRVKDYADMTAEERMELVAGPTDPHRQAIINLAAVHAQTAMALAATDRWTA